MITDEQIWEKINETRKNVDGEISDWAAFRQQQLFEWIKEQFALLRVSNCSQCDAKKEELICHSCAIENYGMGA